MGFDEQKERALKHYTALLDGLGREQCKLLIEELDRGRKIMPEYTLKSAVERVERENNMTILPVVLEDIKDFVALAKGE